MHRFATLLTRPLRGLVPSALLLWSVSAMAAPGEHIRVGDATTVIPEVSAGVEVSSNPFRSERAQQLGFNFLGTLGLEVRYRRPKTTFDIGAKWIPRVFFRNDQFRLNNLSNVRFDANLEVGRQAVVGFQLSDTLRTPSIANDQEFQTNSLLTLVSNTASFGLPIRPGPEFKIVPGMSWNLFHIRAPTADPTAFDGQSDVATRNALTPKLGLEWRFFPNTAFVVEASYAVNLWSQNLVGSRPDIITPDTNERFTFGQFLALPNSQHLKATTGIRGRFTEWLLVQALVGYGFGTYDGDSVDDEATAGAATELAAERTCPEGDLAAACYDRDVTALDALLALARIDFDLGYSKKKRFGQQIGLLYRKDFEDSFFTNYVHNHHLRLALDSMWGKFVRTHVEGGVRFENYEGEYTRNDLFAKVDGWVDILPTSYLSIRVGLLYTNRVSTDPTVRFDNVQGRTVLSFVY